MSHEGTGPRCAAKRVNVVDGLGLRGYDPVAYVSRRRAMRGREEFAHVVEGVTYRFVSPEHRDQFIAHPERYLPQFGGYCALGIAEGHKADADPEAFSVVGGKLYLNYSPAIMQEWRGDLNENLAKAEANWPTVRDEEEVER